MNWKSNCNEINVCSNYQPLSLSRPDPQSSFSTHISSSYLCGADETLWCLIWLMQLSTASDNAIIATSAIRQTSDKRHALLLKSFQSHLATRLVCFVWNRAYAGPWHPSVSGDKSFPNVAFIRLNVQEVCDNTDAHVPAAAIDMTKQMFSVVTAWVSALMSGIKW